MVNTSKAIQVGDQDPELKNSPIQDQIEDDLEYDLHEEISETGFCYFNGQQFDDGAFVCSGNSLLRCDRGIWIASGTCDPDNP